MANKPKHHHLELSQIITLDTECIEGIFSHLNNGVLITDEKGKIIYVNSGFSRITGYSHDEVIGGNPSMLHSGKHDQSFYEKMWEDIKKDGYWRGEIWNRNKSGTTYPEILSINKIKDSLEDKYYFLAIFEDIGFILQDQIKKENLAFYDPLTKLPNRNLLHDRFTQIKTKMERDTFNKTKDSPEEQCAVLFLDLEKFKVVNDTYGHIVGDLLLQHVAKVLKEIARKVDTISRYGGDEFVILLPEIKDKKNVAEFCERIAEGLASPVTLKAIEITTSLSTGIAFFPKEAETFNDILIAADVAMYHAKKNNLGYYFYHNLEKKA